MFEKYCYTRVYDVSIKYIHLTVLTCSVDVYYGRQGA